MAGPPLPSAGHAGPLSPRPGPGEGGDHRRIGPVSAPVGGTELVAMATGGWGKGRAAFWKAGNALSSFCWSQIPHPCLSREAHVTAQAQGGGGAQGEAWPCSGRCGQAGLSLATALNALQATSPPDGPGRHLGLPCHVGGLGQKQRTGGPDTEGAPALAGTGPGCSLQAPQPSYTPRHPAGGGQLSLEQRGGPPRGSASPKRFFNMRCLLVLQL